MYTIKDLNFKPLWNGVQAIMFFPNGYGVSVIKHQYSYGGDRGLWEIAVLKGTEDNWNICYDTDITDDVLGYQTDQDVTDVMCRVQELK